MRHLRASILILGLVLSSIAAADLKVYDVDIKYRQEVFTALRGVLSPQTTMLPNGVVVPRGTVEMLPSGQFLIDTTPEWHEQVAAVLEAVHEHQAEIAPRVTLRYWAVLGSPVATADTDPPAILSDVLDELRRVHGDLAFKVVGNATLVTESGQYGRIDGESLSVRQLTFVDGDTLNTELEIRFLYRFVTGRQAQGGDGPVNPFQTVQAEQQRVELNTSMSRNEFVVVGENSIQQNTVGQGQLDGTIFYIVHWPDAE